MASNITVKAGDSLGRIAARYPGLSWQALYEANKDIIGDNPDMIFPGQELVIPDKAVQKTAATPGPISKNHTVETRADTSDTPNPDNACNSKHITKSVSLLAQHNYAAFATFGPALPRKPVIGLVAGHGFFEGAAGKAPDGTRHYDSGAVAQMKDQNGHSTVIHEAVLNDALSQALKEAFEARGFAVVYRTNLDPQHKAENRFDANIEYMRSEGAQLVFNIQHNADRSNASGARFYFHEDAGAASPNARYAHRLATKMGDGNLRTHRSSVINHDAYDSPNPGADVSRGYGDIPAVLVEAGFMTNAKDLANMTNPAWRKQWAETFVDVVSRQHAQELAQQMMGPYQGGYAFVAPEHVDNTSLALADALPDLRGRSGRGRG
jgi:N-acetylmuramoyl-L-alanine amidase